MAWVLLGLISCIWGSSFILMKKGLQVFSPQEVGALRILSGGILLLPLSLPQLKKLRYRHYKLLFISGLIGIFFPAFLAAQAQTQLDSAVSGVFNSLTPIFVLLVGVMFFRQRTLKSELIGVALGTVGIILLMFFESLNQAGEHNYYVLLLVLISFLYGHNINLTKYYLQDLSSNIIGSVSLLLVGTIAGIFLFTQTEFVTKLQTMQGAYDAMYYVLILGILGLGVAYILFTHLIKLSSTVFASTIYFFIPIVALGWGLLDGEILLWGHYMGMLIILLGVYFVSKPQVARTKT